MQLRNWTVVGVIAALIAVLATAFNIRANPSASATTADVPYFPAVPIHTVEAPRGHEVAILTAPPMVPPKITRNYPATVTVNMDVIEKDMELADGTTYTYWTYGGTAPGPMIRVRQGDRVVFNLHNHESSRFPHNIDLHAVSGPGGGAAASLVIPGESKTFEWTALHPGLYVYHCATPGSIEAHIANQMVGLIYVQDRNPRPDVDHEFYIMQSEFYTTGAFGEKGHQGFDFQKGLNETPDYVVFNGHVGAMNGENALNVNVGESVRLYLGNGGPNLTSAFHVIGAIFDNYYKEGGTTVTHNTQTAILPAGGAAIAEFRTTVPGDLFFVDHAIFRATRKGALGTIRVHGDPVPEIFSGQIGIMAH